MSPDALELSALADFLMDHFRDRGETPVCFCLKTLDLAGLARLATSDTTVALENMAILIELGDISMYHNGSK